MYVRGKKLAFPRANLCTTLIHWIFHLDTFHKNDEKYIMVKSGAIMQVVSLCKSGLDRRHTKGSAAWGYTFSVKHHWRFTDATQSLLRSLGYLNHSLHDVYLLSKNSYPCLFDHKHDYTSNHEEKKGSFADLLYQGIWDDSVTNLVWITNCLMNTCYGILTNRVICYQLRISHVTFLLGMITAL